MFSHLHVHSHYSLLDGASSPEELCQRAAELGYTSLALTDTNNLYGALSFTAAAKEAGLRPIIGAQITQSLPPETNEPYAVVLALDTKGFSELCGLVSDRRLNPDFDLPAALKKTSCHVAITLTAERMENLGAGRNAGIGMV